MSASDILLSLIAFVHRPLSFFVTFTGGTPSSLFASARHLPSFSIMSADDASTSGALLTSVASAHCSLSSSIASAGSALMVILVVRLLVMLRCPLLLVVVFCLLFLVMVFYLLYPLLVPGHYSYLVLHLVYQIISRCSISTQSIEN